MLPKPPGCVGCPFYGDGMGFVPDEINPSAKVAVYMQNPGAEEEKEGKPAIGKTGQFMNTKFLPLAGLNRDQVEVRNTIRCRRQHRDGLGRILRDNDLPELNDKSLVQAVKHCTEAHGGTFEGKRLVIAQGNKALFALTGETSIMAWRGWLRPLQRQLPTDRIWTPSPGEVAVLPTPHLAALFRNPEQQVPAKRDWAKVSKILSGKWPEPMPTILTYPPDVWPAMCAFDTEFVPETGKLIRYSLAYRTHAGESIVHVVEAGDYGPVRSTLSCTVILHNTEADQDYLDGILGADTYLIEDTMHAHAVLAPGVGSDAKEKKERGTPHNLDFLGSLWARTNRWKHLVSSAPIPYSGGDALGTYDVWFDGILPAFKRDPQAEWIYRNRQMPLLPIIRKRRRVGLRVDPGRVLRAHEELESKVREAEYEAQAAVGWSINLASPDQVAKQLYDVEGFGRKKR